MQVSTQHQTIEKSATDKTTYWVAKFGGTSVATYAAMERCASIIANYPEVRVVVVSAPAGVTNLLVKLTESKAQQYDIQPLLNELSQKILAIVACFPEADYQALHNDIHQLLAFAEGLATQLNQKPSRQLSDALLACGEGFSARLFAALLTRHNHSAIYIDARTLIATNNHYSKAEVDIHTTRQQAEKLLLPACANHIVVTEGFIGSDTEQHTTTLGRGGSDYSAAIIAEAIHAGVLQIWTDVSGIYTADPRVVSKARPIDHISFSAAAELANFGAKVLHPATMWPAVRKNIPVFVGSSLDAKQQGTWIRSQFPDDIKLPLLHAITVRHRQILLTINSLEMLHTHGFLARVFTVLANHQLSVDLVTTSEVSVALTLNDAEQGSGELLTPEILEELQSIGNVSLKIDRNLCLIALVGNDLHITSGISGQVFNLLREFNVRLINHGASPHNLCFLVDEGNATGIIQAIHRAFFEA